MLITQAEWARGHGFSRQYMSRLVKRGLVRLVDGKVAPATADAALAAMREPARSPQRTLRPARVEADRRDDCAGVTPTGALGRSGGGRGIVRTRLSRVFMLRPRPSDRRRVFRAIRRETRQRAAVEPGIGDMKVEHRIGRNYLKSRVGDLTGDFVDVQLHGGRVAGGQDQRPQLCTRVIAPHSNRNTP